MSPKPQESFKVLVGLDYPTPAGPVRAERGEVRDDIPEQSRKWLLEQGMIARAAKKAAAPAHRGAGDGDERQ